MHTMYQMYSKHQSVSLHRKKKQKTKKQTIPQFERGQVHLAKFKRGDEQIVYSQFTLNSDLQTYSYTKDCSALLSVLILCSVLLESCNEVTYFQRKSKKNITNTARSEQECDTKRIKKGVVVPFYWV